MKKPAIIAIVAAGAALGALYVWQRRQSLDLNRNQASGPRLPSLPALPPLPAISGAAPNMPKMPQMPQMPSMGGRQQGLFPW